MQTPKRIPTQCFFYAGFDFTGISDTQVLIKYMRHSTHVFPARALQNPPLSSSECKLSHAALSCSLRLAAGATLQRGVQDPME